MAIERAPSAGVSDSDKDPPPGPAGAEHRGSKVAGDDLTRTTFAVLFLALLIASSLWVLSPFLGPAIWATMIVVATWPLMLRVQKRLWRRRSLAVIVMTFALLLLFVVPLTVGIGTIVGNVDLIAGWIRSVTDYEWPVAPPAWASALPVIGSMLARGWEQATALGVSGLLPKLSPYAGMLTRWFVTQIGGVGFLLLQFLVTVVIAAVMYATGEEAVGMVRRFARRLGGERADGVVTLAGGAIRGVALGVGLTAVVQSVLAGAGLLLAGVPFAGLLTALMFMLCIAQIGALPVLVPAAIWAFWHHDTGWGIFLLVWSGVVASLDNILRPLLIRMGADLPLLLIFTGVIGGLLALGLVGIFVGPVVLAVGYTLLEAWMGEIETPTPPPPPLPPPSPPPPAL